MSVKFSKDHEWVSLAGDIATIGITNHAQEQLGDVVFVDVPKVGRQVKKEEAVAVVESVKAASDVFAPISGEIVAVNEELAKDPSLIKSDPADGGWFFKIRIADKNELAGLMDEAAYKAHTA